MSAAANAKEDKHIHVRVRLISISGLKISGVVLSLHSRLDPDLRTFGTP
jgi:hypothetical protein